MRCEKRTLHEGEERKGNTSFKRGEKPALIDIREGLLRFSEKRRCDRIPSRLRHRITSALAREIERGKEGGRNVKLFFTSLRGGKGGTHDIEAVLFRLYTGAHQPRGGKEKSHLPLSKRTFFQFKGRP